MAWIFVPNPPRERPRAWASWPPFLRRSRRLSLRSDNRCVDRQPLKVRIVCDRLEDPVEHALFYPAIIAPLDRLIRPEPVFGQVAPARARARHPQQRVEKTARIAARPALALHPAGNKSAKALPLIVAKNLTVHTGLQKPVLNQSSRPVGILKSSLQTSANTAD